MIIICWLFVAILNSINFDFRSFVIWLMFISIVFAQFTIKDAEKRVSACEKIVELQDRIIAIQDEGNDILIEKLQRLKKRQARKR